MWLHVLYADFPQRLHFLHTPVNSSRGESLPRTFINTDVSIFCAHVNIFLFLPSRRPARHLCVYTQQETPSRSIRSGRCGLSHFHSWTPSADKYRDYRDWRANLEAHSLRHHVYMSQHSFAVWAQDAHSNGFKIARRIGSDLDNGALNRKNVWVRLSSRNCLPIW